MGIAVAHVDEARTRAVRREGDRAGERRVLDEPHHVDDLTRLDIRADADGELGIPLEALGGRHSGNCQTSSRRSGTSAPSRVKPSTSTSSPPTMKSVCTVEKL